MTTKTSKSVSSARSSNVGLAALVKEVSAFLDKAEVRLGPEPPSLTSADKRQVAKPRKGADKIISTIAPIVVQHDLESPSLSATTMMSRLGDAQTLQPLQTRLQKIQKRVDDELFSAQGDAWTMGLQFYSLLQRRAKGDGELATNLEPITKMFAYRHPSTAKTKPTKVQTRAKAKLKSAIALASRHDVSLGGAVPVAATPAGATGDGSAPSAQPPAPPVSAVPAGQYVPVATLAMATGGTAPGSSPSPTVTAQPVASAPAAAPVPAASTTAAPPSAAPTAIGH